MYDNPEGTIAQLAEIAKIVHVTTENRPTDVWIKALYQTLDEGVFRDKVKKNGTE